MAIISSSIGRSGSNESKSRKREVDPAPSKDELRQSCEDGLRPRRLNEYIGQPGLKRVLGIAIKAALGRGDALDHVEGEKWSLRVKLKNKQALFGMRRFSLQHPKRSSWINEWILHNWYAYEGLISLRYKYVNVIINGKNLGIYTLEESFDKEFIENNHRREGPILKFDESRIFDGSLDDLGTVNSTTDLFFANHFFY